MRPECRLLMCNARLGTTSANLSRFRRVFDVMSRLFAKKSNSGLSWHLGHCGELVIFNSENSGNDCTRFNMGEPKGTHSLPYTSSK